MRNNPIEELYFEWMCDLVCDEFHMPEEYNSLLRHLNSYDFSYDRRVLMDENRYNDGIDLRYIFKYRTDVEIAVHLDNRPCSVLEMMVALVNRCADIWGDGMSLWFWEMIKSLGLEGMDEDHYKFKYVNDRLDIFIYRKYEPNGRGGLFTVKNHPRDMRDVDIWCQMSWWLDDDLRGE